jgi:hypothetical protein
MPYPEPARALLPGEADVSIGDWYWRDGSKVEGPRYPEPGWKETMLAVESRLTDPNYRWVARTELSGGIVSTVWLGLDHGFGAGPPLIFETMYFRGLGAKADPEDMQRYSTEAEALAGHEQMVAKWSARQ